ncbi:hypothetical protein [Enterobacter ludwigii]|uniref:hypothetical protein n=1 Tax=Enterobacter ludwigii TaxID=299767 RepID=UPI003F71295E
MPENVLDNFTLDDSTDSLTIKAAFDEIYKRLSISSSVMADLANTLDKMNSEKKLIEDKIFQITGEIKDISTDINIECVEDAERMNELTASIARNESKKVVINGLNKLIDKYNIDIEMLFLENHSHYAKWDCLRATAFRLYDKYRTVKLAEDIKATIDDLFVKHGIYPHVDSRDINNMISSHISSSISAIRDTDNPLKEKQDEAYSLMYDSGISKVVNELPGIHNARNPIVRQQRIVELAKQKASL